MDPGPIYGFGPVGTNGPKPVPPKPPRPACPRYIRRRAKRHEVAADYLATHAKPDSRVPGTLTLHASTNRPTRRTGLPMTRLIPPTPSPPDDPQAIAPAALARCEAATAGPWSELMSGADRVVFSASAPPDGLGDDGDGYHVAEAILWQPDAAFIAAARADLPAAIAEIQRLRAEFDRFVSFAGHEINSFAKERTGLVAERDALRFDRDGAVEEAHEVIGRARALLIRGLPQTTFGQPTADHERWVADVEAFLGAETVTYEAGGEERVCVYVDGVEVSNVAAEEASSPDAERSPAPATGPVVPPAHESPTTARPVALLRPGEAVLSRTPDRGAGPQESSMATPAACPSGHVIPTACPHCAERAAATTPALDLAPIQARADAATAGPWEANNSWSVGGPRMLGVWEYSGVGTSKRDAAFIAHARQDIPALLAEVHRLERQLWSMRIAHDAQRDMLASLMSDGHPEDRARLTAIIAAALPLATAEQHAAALQAEPTKAVAVVGMLRVAGPWLNMQEGAASERESVIDPTHPVASIYPHWRDNCWVWRGPDLVPHRAPTRSAAIEAADAQARSEGWALAGQPAEVQP